MGLSNPILYSPSYHKLINHLLIKIIKCNLCLRRFFIKINDSIKTYSILDAIRNPYIRICTFDGSAAAPQWKSPNRINIKYTDIVQYIYVSTSSALLPQANIMADNKGLYSEQNNLFWDYTKNLPLSNSKHLRFFGMYIYI